MLAYSKIISFFEQHIPSDQCTKILNLLSLRTGAETFAASLSARCRINFPAHPQPWDFYITIRPGPAQPGPDRPRPAQARPGLTTERHPTARPGPARNGTLVCAHERVLHPFSSLYSTIRPGPARPRPAQARPHNGKAPYGSARPGPARNGTGPPRPVLTTEWWPHGSAALTHRVSHHRPKGLAGPIRLPLRLAQARPGPQDARLQHAPARHRHFMLTRISHGSHG